MLTHVTFTPVAVHTPPGVVPSKLKPLTVLGTIKADKFTVPLGLSHIVTSSIVAFKLGCTYTWKPSVALLAPLLTSTS